jgi:hypothetical protein
MIKQINNLKPDVSDIMFATMLHIAQAEMSLFIIDNYCYKIERPLEFLISIGYIRRSQKVSKPFEVFIVRGETPR